MRPSNVVRAMVPAVVCVALVGCSSNNKGKIEGTQWVSVPQTVQGKQLPAGILELDFRADGTVAYKVGPMTYTGKYSLGGGDRLTLNLDQELGGQKKHQQTVKINGDELQMIDSDGTIGRFQRKKPAPPK